MVRFLEWPVIYFSEAKLGDRISGVQCLEEREVEDLVRGKLSPNSEQCCQAHLLWCQSCQTKVEDEFEFAGATRSAIMQLQQQEALAKGQTELQAHWLRNLWGSVREWLTPQIPTHWAAIAVSSVVLIAAVGLLPLRHGTAGQDVVLRSERGSAVAVAVDSSASSNLRLHIDVSDVDPSAAFNVTVVDAGGRMVETTRAGETSGKVNVSLHGTLIPGRYWIRLAAADGRLLREYALRVRQ